MSKNEQDQMNIQKAILLGRFRMSRRFWRGPQGPGGSWRGPKGPDAVI